MRSLSQAPCLHRTRPERRGGVQTLLCRTGIFGLRSQLVSCRIAHRHAHCVDAVRKERSVDSKSKATRASSGRSSEMLRSFSRRSAREDEHGRDAFRPGTFGHKAFS